MLTHDLNCSGKLREIRRTDTKKDKAGHRTQTQPNWR